MGVYNDNVSAVRTHWEYIYTGAELLEAAKRLYDEFYAKEQAAREKMSEYLKDMTISANDKRLANVKRDINSYGTTKEQCMVFKHEFARRPSKEYKLGLGDVTFFGLAEEK